jgi:dihydrofolate reductase
MTIALIAAVAQNGAIGKDNALLWHLPADMKFFRETTQGHVVITGRKNYESIPPKFRPLPNRTNIVVTRQTGYRAPGAIVMHSLENALAEARKLENDTCFIIGGGELYREALQKDLADKLIITHVNTTPQADTFFPEIAPENWSVVTKTKLSADNSNPFDMEFVVYSRNRR